MGDYLDKQEHEIVRELIHNPRISDNKVSKNTNIPLKTVNRKRKKLESKGYLHFFTFLDTGRNGTGDFTARQMYQITFRPGITRKSFLDHFHSMRNNSLLVKHVLESHLGENDGKLVLLLFIESRQESDIIEIFNAEIMPILRNFFGNDSIHDVQTINLTNLLHVLHNYYPEKKKEKVAREKIFVADYTKGETK